MRGKTVAITLALLLPILSSLSGCTTGERMEPTPTVSPSIEVTPTQEPTTTPSTEPMLEELSTSAEVKLSDLTQSQLAIFQTTYDTYQGIGLSDNEAIQLELFDIAYQVNSMVLPSNGEALYQEWRLINHPAKGEQSTGENKPASTGTGTTTPSKPITDAPKPGQSQTDNANSKPSSTDPRLTQGEASSGKYVQTVTDPQTGKPRDAVFHEDETFDHWVGSTIEAITDPTITDEAQKGYEEMARQDSGSWDSKYGNGGQSSTTNSGLSQGEASGGKYVETIIDKKTNQPRDAVLNPDGTFDHWVGNNDVQVTDPTVSDEAKKGYDEMAGESSGSWDETYGNSQ